MRISHNSMIVRRLDKLRRTVRVDSQRVRSTLIQQLSDLLRISSEMARNRSLSGRPKNPRDQAGR